MKKKLTLDDLNKKYSTLKSLLDFKGNIKSAIIRRDWFNDLNIYHYIVDNTKCLNCFNDVKFCDRFFFLFDHMELSYCKKCGKPYIKFDKSQKRYFLCNHKVNSNYKKFIETNSIRKTNLINMLDSKVSSGIISIDNISFTNTVDEWFNMAKNKAFVLSKNNIDFISDLIIKTMKVVPYDNAKLRISERLFIVKNNITEHPKCEYCDTDSYFLNRFAGYAKTCKHHNHNIGRILKTQKLHDRIKLNFNYDKYDLIELPDNLKNDKLVIRCKKCCKITKLFIGNGLISRLHDKRLCMYCENSVSKAEEEVFDFISSIYKGEIIHHENGRKIIPPQELDFYIPEFKLAIEFDGIYWHSETFGGKDINYHVNKTKLCNEKGIKLIHLFENEWYTKLQQVKSFISSELGIFKHIITANDCEIIQLNEKDARNFQNRNCVIPYEQSDINLALKYKNKIVYLITIIKTDNEYIINCICNRNGYNVIDSYKTIINHLKTIYDIHNLKISLNRRWFNEKELEDISDVIEYTSPQPFYFNHGYKMKLITEVEFENIEESRKNRYGKIYDCGNVILTVK